MKFSVIVPVYQVEKYLSQCLDSVLRQTVSDFELILVDDGSTDGSAAICEEYAGKDDRVRLIKQQNGGLSAARNAGIRQARGEYLIFLDSDDYWLTRHGLEEIERCLKDASADAVFWRYRKVDESEAAYSDIGTDDFSAEYCAVPGQMISFLRSGRLVSCAWDVAVSRSLFADGGLDFEPGVFSEDVEWVARLLQRMKHCVFTDMVLNAYRIRGNSITKTTKEKNLMDLNHHYSRIARYITEASGDTAGLLEAYLGEQTANYLLALGLSSSQYLKEYKKCDYLSYMRYCVTKRAKLIRRMKSLFGVSGTIFFIKTIKRFR